MKVRNVLDGAGVVGGDVSAQGSMEWGWIRSGREEDWWSRAYLLGQPTLHGAAQIYA